MKILVSTSATARQQTNAKTVFGSKSVSILKALEEASKEKTLVTPGLDAFLADLKLSGEAFETVSSKASFTKAVAAAKAFVSAKTFTAKIAALKSLKYSSVTGVFPSKDKLAKLKENPDTLRYTKNSKRSKMEELTENQSVPAKNLDELYDGLSDITNGDVTSDSRLLTATIGKNKVSDLQGAADSDGQIGIVLTTPKHEVTILNKKEAPELFAKVAKLAGLGTKSKYSMYIIYADKSSDGPFYSENIKVVPDSAAAFKSQDSKTAFDHLKRLCN